MSSYIYASSHIETSTRPRTFTHLPPHKQPPPISLTICNKYQKNAACKLCPENKHNYCAGKVDYLPHCPFNPKIEFSPPSNQKWSYNFKNGTPIFNSSCIWFAALQNTHFASAFLHKLQLPLNQNPRSVTLLSSLQNLIHCVYLNTSTIYSSNPHSKTSNQFPSSCSYSRKWNVFKQVRRGNNYLFVGFEMSNLQTHKDILISCSWSFGRIKEG